MIQGNRFNHFKYIKPTFAENFRSLRQLPKATRFFSGHSSSGHFLSKTFAEFFSDVDKTAIAFTSLSPSRETAIVTAAGNTYEHLVIITAALASGRTLCLLDPNDPVAAVRKKLQQLALSYIGYSEDEELLISDLNFFQTFPLGDSGTFEEVSFDSRKPAILVFTSGSTGFSKIVEQFETAILANVEAVIEHHDLFRPTVIGTPLPVFHVNALEFGFLGALLTGNQLVLQRGSSPDDLLLEVEKYGINILSLVPHILRALHTRRAWSRYRLSSLRYILTAASALPPKLAKEWIDNCSIPIVQGYGLSEAMNFSTTLPIDLTEEERRRWLTEFECPSVGVELKCNEIEILSRAGELLGEGETGEIIIKGLNLMRGYMGCDNLGVFHDGYLRTGDLGFFIKDRKSGRRFLFVSGRIKDTIKRNGSTIALAQIDQIFSAYSGSLTAISVGFPHDVAGEELGLVVEISDDVGRRELPSIVEFVNSSIPDNLRPRILISTKRSTRTASGKPKRWAFVGDFARWEQAILGKGCVYMGGA